MWFLVLMVSTGSFSDADLQPHGIASFETEAACEAAGQKLSEKQMSFARSIKKDLKFRSDYVCLAQKVGI